MAKKKKSTLDDLKSFDTSKLFSGDKSYMSLVYGVVTVIVIFIIIFLGVRAISQRNVEVTQDAPQTEQQERSYTVKDGDNLWGIAEEVYNDGYKWSLIAEANNLESPDDIVTGMELRIPEAEGEVAAEEGTEEVAMTEEEPIEEIDENAIEEEAEEPAVEPTQAATPAPATGGKGGAAGSYTIVEGDSLWTIALTRYNDGYRWVDIANANSLTNPDLIYPGDQLTLPQ